MYDESNCEFKKIYLFNQKLMLKFNKIINLKYNIQKNQSFKEKGDL